MSTLSNQPPNWNDQDFKDKVKNFEETFERMAHDAGQKVGNMASDYSSKATESFKNLGHYIRENPYKSLAIGTLSGLLSGGIIALVMRTRRK